MPATQSFNFVQLGCSMKNVIHFVYNVLLLFEALYVPVVHKMGTRNGGKIKEAIFHFVLVWKIQKSENSPREILQAYYFPMLRWICLSTMLRGGRGQQKQFSLWGPKQKCFREPCHMLFFYIRFFAYIKYFQKFWRPRPMFYSSIYLHVLWSIVADQIWSWLCVECIASTKRAREETWKWTERSRGDKRAQMV